MHSTILTRVREQQKLTRAEVCDSTKISKSALEGYENLRRFPQPPFLARLAETFEMDIETLYRELCIDFGITDRRGRPLR